jgi:hypothetical protein
MSAIVVPCLQKLALLLLNYWSYRAEFVRAKAKVSCRIGLESVTRLATKKRRFFLYSFAIQAKPRWNMQPALDSVP